MSNPVFLVTPGTVLSVGSAVLLDGPEGRHAAAVRRIRVGETVELCDGAGARATCAVTGAAKDSITCDVVAVSVQPAPSPQITVVQALAKGERADLAVELMTEAGVDAIVPWSAERSIARWDTAKAAKGVERWRTIAREAAKQARRAWVPSVSELASTAQVGAILASADLILVLHEQATRAIATVELGAAQNVVLVVGPEGGLSDHEVNAFGGDPVRLGPEVVRTSTAGALAAAVLLAGTGRWQSQVSQA